MKIKAIALGATFALTALLASAADPVYSVNVVGYHKTTIPPGFSMIANQVDSTNNTVGALFPNPPEGTTIYKFNPATGSYIINPFDFGQWANPNQTLNPGEGAFILNPSLTTSFTNIFAGEVTTGTTTNALPSGFSVVSSVVPQSGALDSALGFPAVDGDVVYLFNSTTKTYQIFPYDFGTFGGTPPVPKVGESFFVLKNGPASWVRTFNVQ
jgi:hypothetical protein